MKDFANGTPKQNAWATRIRDGYLAAVEREKAALATRPNTLALWSAWWTEVRVDVEKATNAGWWCDHHDDFSDPYSFALVLEARGMQRPKRSVAGVSEKSPAWDLAHEEMKMQHDAAVKADRAALGQKSDRSASELRAAQDAVALAGLSLDALRLRRARTETYLNQIDAELALREANQQQPQAN